MSALVNVGNVYPEGRNGTDGCSVFPVFNMNSEIVTFLAHCSLDVDSKNLSRMSKLTLYPVYLRNTYCINNFNVLAEKKCFVFLCISSNFSNVIVYTPNISNKVEFSGELEVIIRNDVQDDGREPLKLTFPGRKGVEFRTLDEKLQKVFNYIASDYIEFVRAVSENKNEKPMRVLKDKIKVDTFPKNLVKVEAIAKPIVTPAAAAGARPAVSGSEKKGFLSKLFS